MRLSELIDGMNITRMHLKDDFDVRQITSDSRDLLDHSIFFAVKGTKDDGLRYCDEVVKKNSVVITDRDPPSIPGLNFICVNDITDAMNILADRFYNHPSKEMKMIGVTGTNGKSSITYLIESISVASKIDAGVIGTINYRYGNNTIPAPNTTPEPLRLVRLLKEMKEAGTGLVVMEVSSHGLALKRTAALKFDVVIFTNLSRDHLDFHKDMEDYFNAKRLLFTKAYSRNKDSAAIVNIDDEYGKRLINEDFPHIYGYSLGDKKAFVNCIRYEIEDDGIKADIFIDNKVISIESSLIGLHNVYNIMAAAGAMYLTGIKPEDIVRGIGNLEYVPGRLQKVKNDLGIRCLVDYAHSDDALRNVLSALKGLRYRKIITVFGAGGDRDRGKRPLMAEAVCEYSNIVIITSDNPRTEDPVRIINDIESGMSKEFIKILPENYQDYEGGDEKIYMIIPDRAQAIRKAVFIAIPDDIILIAGKGHEDYIIEGTTKRHFSDFIEASKAFEERGRNRI